MAKFVAIQMSKNQEKNQDVFQKFTTRELKKTFKCKKVAELKYCKKSNSKVAEISKISEYELNQLSRILGSTDLDDMSESRYKSVEETKVFVFSDDASSTALAIDMLEDVCIIKFFQLDEEAITSFTDSIETIQSADDSISSLNEAKELCESLNTIESDLGLTLVYHSAIDDIDENISDIESDVETSNKTLEEIFDAKWN